MSYPIELQELSRFALPTGPNQFLRIRACCFVQAATLTLDIMTARADGTLITQGIALGSVGTTTVKTFDIPLAVGSLICFGLRASTSYGQCGMVANVYLVDITPASTLILRKLCSGPTSVLPQLTWPPSGDVGQSRLADSTVVFPAPVIAAGATYAILTNSSMPFYLLSWHVQFVTAVAVANRRMKMQVQDAAILVEEWYSSVDQAASLNQTYEWGLTSVVGAVQANKIQVNFPGCYVVSGGNLTILVDNIQAADQLSLLQLRCKPYLDDSF